MSSEQMGDGVGASGNDRPKTPQQLRAGRRWRISVGKEPLTDEASLFMFMEAVEKLVYAADLRERHNKSAKKHNYSTFMGRAVASVQRQMDAAYKALENIREREGGIAQNLTRHGHY